MAVIRFKQWCKRYVLMSFILPNTLSDKQLIDIIENSSENPNVDFKGVMKWDNKINSAKIAKHIAAFANTEGGGFLVIGKGEMNDGGFSEESKMSDDDCSSFDVTTISSWVNQRFNPDISLQTYQVPIPGKGKYIVIHVKEFEECPIICVRNGDYPTPGDGKKQIKIFQEGDIFIRSSEANSTKIVKHKDWQKLVNRATLKRRDNLLGHFKAMLEGSLQFDQRLVESSEDKYTEELNNIRCDLNNNESLKYFSLESGWEMYFHPMDYQEERWDGAKVLKDVINNTATSKNYSHKYPDIKTGTFKTNWGIVNGSYWETWSISKSGLFYYNKPFEEDGRKGKAIRDQLIEECKIRADYKSSNFLEMMDSFRWIEYESAMQVMVQNFAFLKNYVEQYPPGTNFKYVISAKNLQRRHLFSFNLHFDPVTAEPCQSNKFQLKNNVSVEDIISNWKDECAKVMFSFFEFFPGYDISKKVLRKNIEHFI